MSIAKLEDLLNNCTNEKQVLQNFHMEVDKIKMRISHLSKTLLLITCRDVGKWVKRQFKEMIFEIKVTDSFTGSKEFDDSVINQNFQYKLRNFYIYFYFINVYPAKDKIMFIPKLKTVCVYE